MVGLVGVVLVLAVVVVRRLRSWRRMMELARAGAQARAEPVSPEVLTARQRELLVQMGRLGFTAAAPFRVLLADETPGVYASACSQDGSTWFRSLAVGGEDPAGLYLATYFPGGSLVTSSNAHHSLDPREVIQCLPDPAPGRFLALHQEALNALAAQGVEPEPLPEDLLGRVEEEWHAETGAILDVGVLKQILAAGKFWQATRATVPVADRANLDKIVAHLRGVG